MVCVEVVVVEAVAVGVVVVAWDVCVCISSVVTSLEDGEYGTSDAVVKVKRNADIENEPDRYAIALCVLRYAVKELSYCDLCDGDIGDVLGADVNVPRS